MEYLNREFREKDTVGEYDRMAIRYGYTGELPKRTDMFCTDEDVVGPDKPTLSAECSKDDATDDPFSYFGKILDRGLDRLVAPTSNSAPTWLAADLVDQLKIGLTGRIAYATSAESTSKDWIDFKKEGRPDEPAAIKEFVIKTVKDELCSPVLRNAAELKSDQTSRDATVKNIAALDALVDDLASKFGIGAVLKCSP